MHSESISHRDCMGYIRSISIASIIQRLQKYPDTEVVVMEVAMLIQ